jgi:hypothetical protein
MIAEAIETLLDDRDYPVVRLYPERVTSLERFDRLCGSWADVVARGPRFAVISFGDHPDDEPRAVAHERALFFKRNRDVFRDRVAVIVNIEPNAALREEREQEAMKAAAGLGFNIVVVGSEDDAVAIARRHLGLAA